MHYLIIAGPQASGKTTTKKYLEKKCNECNNENVTFLQESRSIINKLYNPFGALTITKDLEYKIYWKRKN